MGRAGLVALGLIGLVVGCAPNDGGANVQGGGANVPKQSPPPPCHPGCFPAGTPVATPEGLRPIESLGQGDVVTLIAADGKATSGPVQGTFQTPNRLIEVRTESGSLVTTSTQPLCLAAGGFRAAGRLAAGDEIWRWQDGQRRTDRVRAVAATGREATVFNLIVGESAVFVADGFLARGKPPADGPLVAAE